MMWHIDIGTLADPPYDVTKPRILYKKVHKLQTHALSMPSNKNDMFLKYNNAERIPRYYFSIRNMSNFNDPLISTAARDPPIFGVNPPVADFKVTVSPFNLLS